MVALRPFGHRGYVARFKVRTSFLERYEVHRVGGRVHDEYWIPAAEVEGVNDNIVGDIEVISIFTAAPPAMVARSYQGPRLLCDFEDDMGTITLGVSSKRDQGITTVCDLDRPPGAVMLSHGEATNRLIDLDFGQARATFSWLRQLLHGQRPVWWGISVRYEVDTDTAEVDLTGDERLCAAARWHDLRCDAKRWQISLGWTEGAGLVSVRCESALQRTAHDSLTAPCEPWE